MGAKLRPAHVKFYRYVTAKVADITHADLNEHSVDLSAFVGSNGCAILVRTQRVAGTGTFNVLSNTGDAIPYAYSQNGSHLVAPVTNGVLYYKLSVINDDWDLYLGGYMREEQ